MSVNSSLDGKKLVSAGSDFTVRIWDINSQQEEAILEGHKDSVMSVSFSPNRNKVVSGSKDGSIRIWYLKLE